MTKPFNRLIWLQIEDKNKIKQKYWMRSFHRTKWKCIYRTIFVKTKWKRRERKVRTSNDFWYQHTGNSFELCACKKTFWIRFRICDLADFVVIGFNVLTFLCLLWNEKFETIIGWFFVLEYMYILLVKTIFVFII